ncbi:MAG: sulfur carrier protein ThiS [Clostridium sp.]|nr:sulfur carrier protein ThiS [Clostridium sp.]MCI7443699.1 sulfur carrier protein ThiS [Clostridium sp.]
MKVNGKEMNLDDGITIDELLSKIKINKDRVVVEVDGVIVLKDEFSSFKLKENNTIEVVSFVGGG